METEKEKTLSEKEIEADNIKQDNGFYWSKDVAEAVARLKDRLDFISKSYIRITQIEAGLLKEEIDEIFGNL